MERMRQADGDIEKEYDAERRHQFLDIISACRIQLESLSSDSVPVAVPGPGTIDVSHQPHVFRISHDIVKLVSESNKRDNSDVVLVRGGLAPHDSGIRPAGVVLVVDANAHADPEVGEGERIRAEGTVVLPPRARRGVDDPGLDDQVGGVDAARQRHLVDGDDLAVDTLDLDEDTVSHCDSLSLPRGDCRPPLFEAKATYDSLYHTRRGLNRQRET